VLSRDAGADNSSDNRSSKSKGTVSAAVVVVTVRTDTLWRCSYSLQPCKLYEPRTAPLVCLNKTSSNALWLNSKLQQTTASQELLQLVGALMAIAPLNQCVLRHSIPIISPLLFAVVKSGSSNEANTPIGVRLQEIEHLNSTLVDAMR
jgi:hypothetical protein